MFALIVTAAMAALYGLTWNNKPARELENAGREGPNQKPAKAVINVRALGRVRRWLLPFGSSRRKISERVASQTSEKGTRV
jgi:hypothetical protein